MDGSEGETWDVNTTGKICLLTSALVAYSALLPLLHVSKQEKDITSIVGSGNKVFLTGDHVYIGIQGRLGYCVTTNSYARATP